VSKPSNTDLIPFLGGTARLTVISRDEAVIVSDEPLVLNGIPLEFRVWVKYNGHHWSANHIFAYRTDNAVYHPQHLATDNQKQKLYRAAVEVAESLTDRQRIRGEISKVRQDIDRIVAEIDELNERKIKSLLELEGLILAEGEAV
jgi:hypothetical protein